MKTDSKIIYDLGKVNIMNGYTYFEMAKKNKRTVLSV